MKSRRNSLPADLSKLSQQVLNEAKDDLKLMEGESNQSTTDSSKESVDSQMNEVSDDDIKVSLYDVKDIDKILSDKNISFDKFFHTHFSHLTEKNKNYIPNQQNLIEIFGEATLIAKLEIQLIQYAAESGKIENKDQFIKNFQNTEVYKNYYGEDGLVKKVQGIMRANLGNGFQGIVDNMMYSTNDLSKATDFNDLHNKVKSNMQELKQRMGSDMNKLNLNSVQNRGSYYNELTLGILASNPKLVGLMLANEKSIDNKQKSSLTLEAKKSLGKTRAKRVGIIVALVLLSTALVVAGALIGGLGAAIGFQLGGVAAAATGVGLFTATGRKITSVLEEKLSSIGKADSTKEATDASKKTALTFNENHKILKNNKPAKAFSEAIGIPDFLDSHKAIHLDQLLAHRSSQNTAYAI